MAALGKVSSPGSAWRNRVGIEGARGRNREGCDCLFIFISSHDLRWSSWSWLRIVRDFCRSHGATFLEYNTSLCPNVGPTVSFPWLILNRRLVPSRDCFHSFVRLHVYWYAEAICWLISGAFVFHSSGVGVRPGLMSTRQSGVCNYSWVVEP